MELRELQEKLAGREALEAELESLNQKGSELNARLRAEKLNLEYEQSDVEALESNTLKSFFYTAIGKKEERLMKEEDEAAQAKAQYEGTLVELEQVNARIKRIKIELRNLERAERDYKNLVKDLSARIAEVKPKMTNADAIALEQVQRELAEQAQKQVLYACITEECEELQKRMAWVEEALREAREEREKTMHGKAVYETAEYYDRRYEAEERRKTVQIQAQRIKAHLNQATDGEIDAFESYQDKVPKDRLARMGINVVGNLRGLLSELEERTQSSKRYQAELESRLSELLAKYQTT